MDAPIVINSLPMNFDVHAASSQRKKTNSITCRVTRVWKIHNRVDGEPDSLNFVAVDEKGRALLCSIEARVVPKFEKFIKLGAIYNIKNFRLAKMRAVHRVLNDSEYYMVLDASTRLDRVCVNAPTILLFKFQLISFTNLLSVSNHGKNLCDVIGRIGILYEIEKETIGGQTIRTLSARLSDLSGSVVNVSVCGEDPASDLNSRLNVTDRICILTSMAVSPGILGGLLLLSSSDASEINASFKIPEIREFHQRYLDAAFNTGNDQTA